MAAGAGFENIWDLPQCFVLVEVNSEGREEDGDACYIKRTDVNAEFMSTLYSNSLLCFTTFARCTTILSITKGLMIK